MLQLAFSGCVESLPCYACKRFLVSFDMFQLHFGQAVPRLERAAAATSDNSGQPSDNHCSNLFMGEANRTKREPRSENQEMCKNTKQSPDSPIYVRISWTHPVI